jgi:hypothetical protein
MTTRLLTTALLAATLVFSMSAGAQGKKPPALPDGAGKDRVEAMCMACHQSREIVNSSGYTR